MPHPPILVTFALPQESRDFRAALQPDRDRDIRVAHFGVGPAAAAERMTQLLQEEKPRLVICSGFAGGLDLHLGSGALVVGENLSTTEVVPRVREVVLGGLSISYGAIVSRPAPVESVEAKAALFRETGALAVDMESEAIAEVCRAAVVPLLVIRVISDSAAEPLPVPFDEWFDMARQRPRTFRLLKYLAFHPNRVGPFADFVRGLAPARRSLAEFLLAYLAPSTPPD